MPCSCSQAEAASKNIKQISKAQTTLIQKKWGEQCSAHFDVLDSMVAVLESSGIETKRFTREIEKQRKNVQLMVNSGLTDTEVTAAEAIAQRESLAEAVEQNALLMRKIRAMEIRYGKAEPTAEERASLAAVCLVPGLPHSCYFGMDSGWGGGGGESRVPAGQPLAQGVPVASHGLRCCHPSEGRA